MVVPKWFGTTFETITFSEWPHTQQEVFMITSHKWSGKPGTISVIQDDIAEVESILEAEWMVEEDNFRRFLNGLDKAEV